MRYSLVIKQSSQMGGKQYDLVLGRVAIYNYSNYMEVKNEYL